MVDQDIALPDFIFWSSPCAFSRAIFFRSRPIEDYLSFDDNPLSS
jgi:hypothetical protein